MKSFARCAGACEGSPLSKSMRSICRRSTLSSGRSGCWAFAEQFCLLTGLFSEFSQFSSFPISLFTLFLISQRWVRLPECLPPLSFLKKKHLSMAAKCKRGPHAEQWYSSQNSVAFKTIQECSEGRLQMEQVGNGKEGLLAKCVHKLYCHVEPLFPEMCKRLPNGCLGMSGPQRKIVDIDRRAISTPKPIESFQNNHLPKKGFHSVSLFPLFGLRISYIYFLLFLG